MPTRGCYRLAGLLVVLTLPGHATANSVYSADGRANPRRSPQLYDPAKGLCGGENGVQNLYGDKLCRRAIPPNRFQTSGALQYAYNGAVPRGANAPSGMSAPALGNLGNPQGGVDLIVGGQDGHILVYPNAGTSKKPVFTHPFYLDASSGSGPTNFCTGFGVDPTNNGLNAANCGVKPALADLNADGFLDMVYGVTTDPYTFTSSHGTAYNEHSPRGDLRMSLGNSDGTFQAPTVLPGDAAGALRDAVFGVAGVFGQATLWSPAPCLGDLTGDGLPDLLVGLNDGTYRFLHNAGTPTAPMFVAHNGDAAGMVGANPLQGIDVGSFATCALADMNGDGRHDLLLGDSSESGHGHLKYFENTGSITSWTDMPMLPATLKGSYEFRRATGSQNPMDLHDVQENSSPAMADLDGDGLPEVVVGTRTGTVLMFQDKCKPGTYRNSDLADERWCRPCTEGGSMDPGWTASCQPPYRWEADCLLRSTVGVCTAWAHKPEATLDQPAGGHLAKGPLYFVPVTV